MSRAAGIKWGRINSRKTTGDIIGPEESENSFEIYRVFDKSEDRALTIEDDRQVIEEFARQIKSSRLIEEHIDKLREDYYIEIRI